MLFLKVDQLFWSNAMKRRSPVNTVGGFFLLIAIQNNVIAVKLIADCQSTCSKKNQWRKNVRHKDANYIYRNNQHCANPLAGRRVTQII